MPKVIHDIYQNRYIISVKKKQFIFRDHNRIFIIYQNTKKTILKKKIVLN